MQRLAEVTDAPTAWEALRALAIERQGGLALDIGANTGQASAVLAPWFERVIAFEPVEESAAILIAECEDNVELCSMAVSQFMGRSTLDVADQAIATGQLVTATALPGHPEWGTVTGTRQVLATTVDAVVGAGGVLPSLVKVDTEGHEGYVIAGAEHTIALNFTTWFIEVHAGHFEEPLRLFFGNYHYDVERIDHDYLVTSPERAAHHFYLVARPR